MRIRKYFGSALEVVFGSLSLSADALTRTEKPICFECASEVLRVGRRIASEVDSKWTRSELEVGDWIAHWLTGCRTCSLAGRLLDRLPGWMCAWLVQAGWLVGSRWRREWAVKTYCGVKQDAKQVLPG